MEKVDHLTKCSKSFNNIRNYNQSLLTFKGIHGRCPPYISNKFTLCKDFHNFNTRSSSGNNLFVNHQANNTLKRTFQNQALTALRQQQAMALRRQRTTVLPQQLFDNSKQRLKNSSKQRLFDSSERRLFDNSEQRLFNNSK